MQSPASNTELFAPRVVQSLSKRTRCNQCGITGVAASLLCRCWSMCRSILPKWLSDHLLQWFTAVKDRLPLFDCEFICRISDTEYDLRRRVVASQSALEELPELPKGVSVPRSLDGQRDQTIPIFNGYLHSPKRPGNRGLLLTCLQLPVTSNQPVVLGDHTTHFPNLSLPFSFLPFMPASVSSPPRFSSPLPYPYTVPVIRGITQRKCF